MTCLLPCDLQSLSVESYTFAPHWYQAWNARAPGQWNLSQSSWPMESRSLKRIRSFCSTSCSFLSVMRIVQPGRGWSFCVDLRLKKTCLEEPSRTTTTVVPQRACNVWWIAFVVISHHSLGIFFVTIASPSKIWLIHNLIFFPIEWQLWKQHIR